MITYNHEKFIAQAIESVLMQKTSFPFELVIGEDCSTDKTREICQNFKNNYPDRIELILNDSNIGMMPNFVQTLKACKGKYVALLEGDDYWTYPNKLQEQVEFLETNPEYVMCFHNSKLFYEDDSFRTGLFIKKKIKNTFTIKDILRGNFIPTQSVVFRNSLIKEFPQWFYHAMPGDWFLHIFNAHYGLIKYFNEVWATYRIHKGGVYSGPSKICNFEKTIIALEKYCEEIDLKYRKYIKRALSKRYFSVGKLLLKNNMKKEALKKTIKSVKIYPLSVIFVFHEYAKFFLFVLIPNFKNKRKTLTNA